MTLKEFKNATFAKSDLVHLINVMDHKIASILGPAVMVFSKFLYLECLSYFQHMRNQLEGIGKENADKFL